MSSDPGPGPDHGGGAVELVAHRAGNDPDTIPAAAAVADLVELDVHSFRGRVEVRHAKVIWPWARQWERWYLLPTGVRSPSLADQLAVIDPATPLLVDVKCFTTATARRIAAHLPPERPAVVASRSWWVLRAFATRPGVRLLRSCGNRLQLAIALRWPRRSASRGIAIHERLLKPTTIPRLLRRTPWLFTWGVADEDRARELVGAGVTGLIIDDLDLIGRLRRGPQPPE